MAHEIDMTTGRAAIAYSKKGGTPWHALGTAFDDLMTSAEALEGASLNFSVEKRQAHFINNEGNAQQVPGRFVTVRSDTVAPLGTVGEGYEVIQNVEAFDFMDNLIETGEVRYEVAGALRGGATVWMLAKMPEATRISYDDVVDNYLLLTNSHDGSKACSVAFTTVRVVCANTLKLAKQQGLKHEFKIRHSGNIQSKLAQAQEVLGLAQQGFDTFGKQARAMSFTTYKSQAEVDRFLNEVIGIKNPDDMTKQQETARYKMRGLLETGRGTDLPGVKGTYWGLLNAVTEYVDHERGSRNTGRDVEETRLEAITWGGGQTMKERAYSLALAAV